MPNPKLGSNYTFSQLLHAYGADVPGDADAHFLLYKGEEILALCLRHKFNPKAGEVWVGDDPTIAQWGVRLAGLKDKKALPLYHSDRGRTLYTYKGDCLISGDTNDPKELAQRKGPAPLSRIVFIRSLQQPEPTASARS
jgi:hypothetical protein